MSCTEIRLPPTSMFPLFPLLPLELRLKIWQHTLQPRRLVWDMEDDWPSTATGPLSRSCPAINACHEARRALSPRYTFCTDAASAPIPGHGAWVNFDSDTVCLLHGMWQLEHLLETRNPILDGLRWLELVPSDECDVDRLVSVRGLGKLELVSVVMSGVEAGGDDELDEGSGEGFLVGGNGRQVASQSNFFPSWAHTLSFTLSNMGRALDLGYVSESARDQDGPPLVVVLASGLEVFKNEGILWDLIQGEDGFTMAELDQELMECVMARFFVGDRDGDQGGGWMIRRIFRARDTDADFYLDLTAVDDADGSEFELASEQSSYEPYDI